MSTEEASEALADIYLVIDLEEIEQIEDEMCVLTSLEFYIVYVLRLRLHLFGRSTFSSLELQTDEVLLRHT